MKENIDWTKWNSKEDNFKKYAHIKSNLIYGTFFSEIPEVSIMIITYKRADGLKNALESAINQDYTENYEIVVCDDSGFDQATDDLMKEYCSKYSNIVYYRHEKNLGQYANWNRACELCRTEWYCLLHDDDQLNSNYLSTLIKYKKSNFGLIGVYFNQVYNNEEKNKKGLIIFLTKIFVKLRKNPIKLKISDHLKHIFIFSCCLFINRNKYIDCGGLNSDFYPSSDFDFDSKMTIYHSIAFLPKYLAKRNVGECASVNLTVCKDSIICAYKHTFSMCNYLNYSKSKCKRVASFAAVISEIGVKGYNNIDYSDVKNELGMNSIYNNRVIIALINLYSKFNWGLLLFRKSVRG